MEDPKPGLKFKGVLTLAALFSVGWSEQCQHWHWANGKLSMESNARWSPDTPRFLSSSCSLPPVQLQKVRDLGRGRIMIIQSRGEGRVGIQRSRLWPAGALFWGHSAITVRRQANPFLLKYLHPSHIPSTWNGRVISSVDWGEIAGRWSDRWHSRNWQLVDYNIEFYATVFGWCLVTCLCWTFIW